MVLLLKRRPRNAWPIRVRKWERLLRKKTIDTSEKCQYLLFCDELLQLIYRPTLYLLFKGAQELNLLSIER
jgi:hypothetical protein